MIADARKPRLYTRIVSLFITTVVLANSAFAAPEAASYAVISLGEIGREAKSTWQKTDLSHFLDVDLPNTLALIVPKNAKAKSAVVQIDRIEIGQRDRTVIQGEAIDFVATAYRGEQSVGGVAFRWSIRKGESGESRPLANGRFRAAVPGRYIVQVSSGGYSSETSATVLPDPAFNISRIMRKPATERTIEEQKLVAEWIARGLLATHAVSSRDPQPVIGVGKSKRTKSKASGDVNRINSVDPIGWDNSNYATADDPVNWVGRPIGAASKKGAANGNYNLTIPAVNLDGRGDLGINLNLEYNSRLWSKFGTEMTYNADSGYPAPGWNLGYGKMFYTGTSGGCIFVSPDGTRRSYNGSSSLYNSGGVYSDTFSGYTTDGSMIEYGCNYYSYGSYTTVTGWAQLPNGTIMTFNSPSSNFDQTFPTRIVDRHGNYIDITYEGGYGPAIDTITDTLGRTIDFNYNGTALRSISGPGYNGTTRTFIRFEYFHQTIATSGMFGSPITATNVANTTPYQIKAIFYPTTANGYWFCGSSYYSPCGTDAYSPYGIIRTILAQRGMNWNSGPDTIDWGTTNRSEVYDFPTSASTSYTDSPGYGTHTETFDGIDTSSLVTYYSTSTSGSYETITVTRPDTSKLIQKSNVSDGLQIENRIENSSSTVLDKTVTTLGSGGAGDFYSPRPTAIEHTDDKNQVTKTEFTYGTSVYNQVTAQKEYDYGGTTLYREKRFTYENSANYTNQHVLNLVKTAEDYNNSNGRLTRTVYSYDGATLEAASGIVQHDYTYDPYTSETVNGSCLLWNPDGAGCSYEGEWVDVGGNWYICGCETYDQVSAFNSATAYRGNLTNVTTYTDGAAATGAISYDYTYDIAGNERTSTTNCCQQIGSSYSTATQYLLPDSITKGSSNPSSPDRVTQSYSYDANTKVPTSITDFNGLATTISYDAVLRPTLVTLNSGGKKTTTYTDSSNYVTEHVQKADNTTVSQSISYFNGRGQVNKSTYQAGASNWNGTQIKYDEMGRQWKVSRPYDTASSPSYWSEITYDKLSRPLSQIAPDGSTSTLTYNGSAPSSASSNVGQTVTSADAWGRQRWSRTDAFGRLVEAVEPDPASSTGSVTGSGNINTTYAYDRLDRLTTITQGSQTRSFGYDSLGRMTQQKLAEQHASLSSSGTYMSSGGTWSDVFEYDSRSNLKKRTDARGVVTTFEYNVSGSPDPLNRLQNISYSTASADTTYTIHAAPTVSFEYMTTGDKTRVKKVTASGVSTEENAFDTEGRISSYKLTLDAQPYKPFETNYSYDTAHRLTQIDYPKKYQMSAETQAAVVPSYDQASRLTQLNYEGTTYLSDIGYNTASQVTSLKTGNGTSTPRVEGYTYDAATGLLTGQTVKNSALSSTYLDLSYSYARGGSAGSNSSTEKTGQMTKIDNNLNRNRDRTYEFDALGRLAKAKGGLAAGASSVTANWTQTYTYDRYGNKTATAAQSGSVDENNASVAADGLTSTATDTGTNRISAYTYDRAGNVTRGQNPSGTWLRYEYDAAGRLKKVKDDSSNDIETYSYGAGRQKLVMDDANGTYYYVWGGSSIIAEYQLVSASPRWLKSYVYAGSRLLMTAARITSSSEKKETHHPDRLGTKLVTNTGGGTDYQQSTLPFGTAFGAESSGYSNQVFTSYDRSAGTGLDYANNRTYSSGDGRFSQVDPIGMASASIGNPQSNNLYAYTQNMPTDFVDPSGLLRIQQCTRNWVDYGDGGGRHYTSQICVTIYDDGESGSSGSGNAVAPANTVGNDCQKLADKVSQLARSIDPSHPNAAGQVQNFMDSLAQWATEFGYATSAAVAAGLASPNSFPDFGDVGFQTQFQGSDSPNQVRHTIGGLIVGFISVGGDSRAARVAMAMKEIRIDLSTDAADIALNGVTMPIGAKLAGTNGAKTAVGLADWIRENLCSPVGREGVGRPN
ncbi:MAG: RHS repeat-associated core domain-containing protein [Pyrinomonadaceae bacterium]